MAESGTGLSLLLIAVGAIIRWAITAHIKGVSLPNIGLILIIVGIIGFIVSMLEMFMWAPRRRVRATPAEYETTRRYG